MDPLFEQSLSRPSREQYFEAIEQQAVHAMRMQLGWLAQFRMSKGSPQFIVSRIA